MHLSRDDPRLWHELKLVRKGLNTLIEMTSHVRLIRNEIHPNKMVKSLVRFHPTQLIRVDDNISPADIPILTLLPCKSPSKFVLSSFPHHVVPAI
jgi:hypothetical protein